MTTHETRSAKLRALLANDRPVVAPGVYDALTARLVERAGFACAFVSGAAVSAGMLAMPDLGSVSMSEMLETTRQIVRATTIPVISDCDTGYGGTLNVRRTVQEWEDAGVAALFIEDQVFPKRCGHFAGKSIVGAGEMVEKIAAAVDARRDGDLVLIARTDAIAIEGMAGTVRRMEQYARAGADMIFVDAPESVEELAAIPKGSPVPTMVNLVEGGKTPLLTVHELHAMGFKLVTFSGTLQKAAIKAMEEALALLNTSGDLNTIYPSRVVSLEHRSEILGLRELLTLDESYKSKGMKIVDAEYRQETDR